MVTFIIGENMLSYENVINQSKAFNMIKLDASENRISHAYLFVSQDENYLFEFSKQVATLLINLNEKENIEKNELRIKSMTHPDVKYYGNSNENVINAEVVGKINEQAQVCPFEADKKIFVLCNVQNMNEISQNKILKTIEEPPKNTYFLLCASGTSRILTTILSRVKQIEIENLNLETITKMLVSAGSKQQDAEIFASCSNGNSSFAEKLALDEGFLGFFNNIVSCFFDIKGSRDVLKYSSIFTGKNIDKNEFFDIAMLISRDLSMIIAGKSELVICKNVLQKLKVIASTLNLSSTSELIKCCLKSKENLNFNANQTAVIDGFLFKIAEVKVKCRRLLV